MKTYRILFISLALAYALGPQAWPTETAAQQCYRIQAFEALNTAVKAASSPAEDSSRLAKVISDTQDAPKIAARLRDATSNRLRHSLKFRSPNGSPSILSSNPAQFRNTQFLVSKEPTSIPEGASRVGPLEIGYDSSDEFKSIAPINYAIVGRDGSVLEIGGGSDEALREVKRQIFGRIDPKRQLETIAEINRKLVHDLRSKPTLQEKLRAFAKKRGWPPGLEDKAALAYFDENELDLFKWAKENGYTASQMRDAGWLTLKFTKQGKAYYKVNNPNSIKIPFFADDSRTGISVWRTRQMDTRDPTAPKYLSWPLDRSSDRTFSPAETLYNGWNLKNVKGKTVVITEGEFKSLVAQDATGIATFGLRGITELDPATLKALVNAGAKDYVIILDRDPRASGLMRVDGVSDSQRAAYSIADRLQRAGAKSVRVGVLPDAFDGGKVGIDDLILAKGTMPYLQVIKDAVSPSSYAQQIGLDPDFQTIVNRRQELRSAIEKYKASASRGGPLIPSTELQQAQAALKKLNETYLDHLFKQHNGATSMSQASSSYTSISQVSEIKGQASKQIVRANGESLPLRNFQDEALVLDYAPRDIAPEQCKPAPCSQLPYTSKDLWNAVNGKTDADAPEAIEADFQKGIEIAKNAGFEPKTPQERALVSLVGNLSQTFPEEDYAYDFGTRLQNLANGSPTDVETIPVMIRKQKNGRTVAVAQLRLPGETDDQKQISRDLDEDGKKMERILSYLRPGQI